MPRKRDRRIHDVEEFGARLVLAAELSGVSVSTLCQKLFKDHRLPGRVSRMRDILAKRRATLETHIAKHSGRTRNHSSEPQDGA